MPPQNRPNHVETQQMVSDSVFMDPAPTISHKNPVQSPPISLEAFISSISQWKLQQEAFNANISLELSENGNTFFGMKVFIFDPGGDIFDVHYVSEKWPIYGDSQITNDNFDKEEVEVEVEQKNVGAMLNISLSSTVENLKSTLSLCEVLKQRLQADIFNNVGKGIIGILRQDGINVCKLHALSTHNIYPNTISFAHQIPLQTEYMLPPSSLTYNTSTPPFTHVLHHYPTKVLDNSSTKLSPPARGCSLDKLIASLAEMKFSSTKKFASAAVKKAEPMKNTQEWKAASILTEKFKAMLMASISSLVRVGNDLVIQCGIILAPDVVDDNICDTDQQARRKNCQCAMQYSWSMEARAQRALVNVSALFEPDGPFKRTMTDANVIIKRLREADGLSFGNSAYWISVD